MKTEHISPRIIPALLLLDGKFVKTRKFAEPVYVGDPVNVLSIFNEFEVDEIALLDIGAATSRRSLDLTLLERIASECFIPLSYGGGVETAGQARAIVRTGIEKVIVNSALVESPQEVRSMVESLGSQAVVGSVDVRWNGQFHQVFTHGGTQATNLTLDDWIDLARLTGVGEVLATSIDREGTLEGVDLEMVRSVTRAMNVPVIAHGGVGSRADLATAIHETGASAVAVGSHFVFKGGRDSVLINYPSRAEIDLLMGTAGKGMTNLVVDELVESEQVEKSDLHYQSQFMCKRCLISLDVPNVDLDEQGVCYYCRLHDELELQFPTGQAGEQSLHQLANRLKTAGKGRKYDCIIGVSGGCDSSYLIHVMVKLGVRPLAVHFDNTWNSPIATSNIYAVLDKLNVPLETYVVDNVEYDDLYRSFMLAGVRDVEAPTDIGFMGVLYRAAEKHGVRNILEGHSFRTEGISPLGWLYMDGGYVKSVHSRYGTVPLQTYPNMEFGQFVRWAALSGIQRDRPLYHLDYNKEDAKQFLAEEYGWQWYGGHHLENRFTAFYHSYLLPTRFGIDFRQIELSALVRSGQLGRIEALRRLNQPREPDSELLALVKKRLGFSEEEFEAIMLQPQQSYRDFDTYKQRFQRLRPFFWLLYKAGRVPKSFYVKFCT